jgi:hypothetical protein
LEARSYNAAIKEGHFRPFEISDTVVICSYQFARGKAADVHSTPSDLVVIDEAHRLRNVYKPSNVIANTLKGALVGKQKLLLTATPLQNSLLELYGLVSFIDEHTFGDLKSFREQFASLDQDRMFQVLRERLKPICHRTLRRQVTAYVPSRNAWRSSKSSHQKMARTSFMRWCPNSNREGRHEPCRNNDFRRYGRGQNCRQRG